MDATGFEHKAHLAKVEHVGGDVVGPLVLALGALLLHLPIPKHRRTHETNCSNIFKYFCYCYFSTYYNWFFLSSDT